MGRSRFRRGKGFLSRPQPAPCSQSAHPLTLLQALYSILMPDPCVRKKETWREACPRRGLGRAGRTEVIPRQRENTARVVEGLMGFLEGLSRLKRPFFRGAERGRDG